MNKFANFIRYDNTIPLLLIVVFMGSALTFASPEVGSAVLSSTQRVVSIDNSYIVNINLENYSPKVVITSVTEDSEDYFIKYNLQTLGVKEGSWQPITLEKDFKVNKKFLGEYLDLGIYVTKQLNEVIDQEKALLVGTQEIEKKNISQKVVATEYSGLVGKFLDETTEVLPGYTPVNTETPEISLRENTVPVSNNTGTTSQTNNTETSTTTTTENTNAPAAPVTENALQVLGGIVQDINIGASYTDQGVFLSNGNIISVIKQVNGEVVETVTLDTTAVKTYTIVYTAQTDKGELMATKTVNVVDPTIVPVAPIVPETTPVTETPAPATETQPVVETPVTPTETAPVMDTPAPAVETPAPAVETPAQVETPAPVTEAPVQ